MPTVSPVQASGPGTRQLQTCLGHTMTVFGGDHIADSISKFGLFEKERLLVLRKLLKQLPQPVVLDIGANIGNHALVFATCAAAVHAFEPIPAIFALLQRNIADNKLGNVQPHLIALSDANGAATIYLANDDNVGMSSFDQRANNTKAVQVIKKTGDDFLTEHRIGKVDFIKIDVEAHEYFVIKGLMQCIKRDLPIITLEWNDQLTVARFTGTGEWRFLQAHYSFFALGINHDRTVWQGKPFAFFRRKWNRLLPRKAVIHEFNPACFYDSVLLVPKGREALLDHLGE